MGRHTGLVTRLLFRAGILAAAAGVVALASWAIAANTLSGVLGSPPPDMGTQATTFLWDGVPTLRGRPMAWRFSFRSTRIPGTPNVRVYVSPTGRLLLTEPADLAVRVKTWNRRGFL